MFRGPPGIILEHESGLYFLYRLFLKISAYNFFYLFFVASVNQKWHHVYKINTRQGLQLWTDYIVVFVSPWPNISFFLPICTDFPSNVQVAEAQLPTSLLLKDKP